MPARCKTCEEELSPERTLALMEQNVSYDEMTCIACTPKVSFFGVMAPGAEGISGGKTNGKTGNVLNIIRLDGSPEANEKLRQAKRFINRAR